MSLFNLQKTKSKIKNKKNILILMSGSIACYKVCSLISKLVQNNFNVKVAMSASARKFVGVTTIEGLSQNLVHTDTFEIDHAMEHIHLARWADIILMAPATANTINKISCGIGDDLITTLFLAHDFKKPFLIAPAMNTQMYLHPITQKSITILKKMNVEILETASGVLACGEVGYGRLLEPELLYSEIIQKLEIKNLINHENLNSNNLAAVNLKPKKVLITSGGTQEPIDNVRVITNKSTGKTASIIADQFINAGFSITYLCAKSAARPKLDCEIIAFESFKDLDLQIDQQLKNNYDIVIHAAAVSDYSLENSVNGKINSSAESLQINLVRNPKLIDKIKLKSPKTKLVGFKLTSSISNAEIQNKISDQFKNANCDFIVHNDWSNVHTDSHVFNLYEKNKSIEKNLSVIDLSYALINLFCNTAKEIL